MRKKKKKNGMLFIIINNNPWKFSFRKQLIGPGDTKLQREKKKGNNNNLFDKLIIIWQLNSQQIWNTREKIQTIWVSKCITICHRLSIHHFFHSQFNFLC